MVDPYQIQSFHPCMDQAHFYQRGRILERGVTLVFLSVCSSSLVCTLGMNPLRTLWFCLTSLSSPQVLLQFPLFEYSKQIFQNPCEANSGLVSHLYLGFFQSDSHLQSILGVAH